MALLTILLIFIVIITTNRYLKIKLWISILIGAILSGLIFQMTIKDLFITFYQTLTNTKTLELLFILYAIAILECTLRNGGLLTKIVLNFKKTFKNEKIVLSFLPMLLGFLPSPGGAMFSAPLVEEASKNLKITNEEKSFINFWFRHIWETVFPLFPGLILAATISKIPMNTLIYKMFPALLISVTFGYIIIFFKNTTLISNNKLTISNDLNKENKNKNENKILIFYELIKSILPIIIIITGTLFLKIKLVILIIFAIIWTFFQTNLPFKNIYKIIVETIRTQNLMLVVTILIFANVLEKSKAALQISQELISINLPFILIITILPFIVAVFTGINTAFVGLTFPIILNFKTNSLTNVIASAYIAGVAGVMISPLHLCLILSINYFKADIIKFYKLLFLPALALFILALIIGGI